MSATDRQFRGVIRKRTSVQGCMLDATNLKRSISKAELFKGEARYRKGQVVLNGGLHVMLDCCANGHVQVPPHAHKGLINEPCPLKIIKLYISSSLW